MIAEIVRSVADMFSNFFGWRTSASNNEAMHEVIDDKKDLEKACKYPDEACSFAQAHAFLDEVRHGNHFDMLVRKFRRYR